MSEKAQVLFMQIRLVRLAAETWNILIEDAVRVFRDADVFGYIEKGYGIFYCEGDEAILEDISEFIERV